MTTVTTTTYAPVVPAAYAPVPAAQPRSVAQPVYAPVTAQPQLPVVASSYTPGKSLPDYDYELRLSLNGKRPAVSNSIWPYIRSLIRVASDTAPDRWLSYCSW